MTDIAEPVKPARSMRGVLISSIVALLLGGATFAVVYLDIVNLPFVSSEENRDPAMSPDQLPEDSPALAVRPGVAPGARPVFVALPPIVVSLAPPSRSSHLRVGLSIEVAPMSEPDVQALMPRIVDVLQTFLRAVDARDFETPRAMARLRAQMLRRVQLVTPEGAVRDLLVQDFILN